ncbi:MAG: PQQ-dependent sugar dehydrogenase [Gammaproteobacteria bacterium]
MQDLSSRAPAAAKCTLGNSYGNEYSTAPIGDGLRAQDGLEEPIYFWVPSIAPSGMLFYTGDLFPEWQGNLFGGSLVAQHLTRLVLDGDRVVAEERPACRARSTHPRRPPGSRWSDLSPYQYSRAGTE